MNIFPCSALTFFIAAFDVALAVYNRYADGGGDSHNTVAYAAHVGGALAGCLVGMNVLRNFHKLVSYIVLGCTFCMVAPRPYKPGLSALPACRQSSK